MSRGGDGGGGDNPASKGDMAAMVEVAAGNGGREEAEGRGERGRVEEEGEVHVGNGQRGRGALLRFGPSFGGGRTGGGEREGFWVWLLAEGCDLRGWRIKWRNDKSTTIQESRDNFVKDAPKFSYFVYTGLVEVLIRFYLIFCSKDLPTKIVICNSNLPRN